VLTAYAVLTQISLMSWPQREALASLCTSILFLPHLFAPTGLTFAFGGQRLYAANRGTTPSINRKNRVLRAPATTDSCDIGADDPEGSPFAFHSAEIVVLCLQV
jgi:hypothetical protein